MVHAGHFQQTPALGHGLPPELVSFVQVRLFKVFKVGPQRRGILFHQFRVGGHGLIPWYRATRTSESSVTRPPWARIRSAIWWGGLVKDRPSSNPLRIPSVAKIIVSPKLRGCTNARKAGSRAPTTPREALRNSELVELEPFL